MWTSNVAAVIRRVLASGYQFNIAVVIRGFVRARRLRGAIAQTAADTILYKVYAHA